MACGILVPPPRIEPAPPAVEAQVSFFLSFFLKLYIYLFRCTGSWLLHAGFL